MNNIKDHLIKYCDEALGLGLFMVLATLATILFELPSSPLHVAIPSSLLQRLFIGIAMGVTALGIFLSPFGKKSGAYINPSVTFIRYILGDISLIDALFYTIAQCLGAILGMYIIYWICPNWVSNPSVNYIVTEPQNNGELLAFVLEILLSFIIIVTVLYLESQNNIKKFTPYIIATLIALFITFEAPFSGMSINPARSLASSIIANSWKSFWIYCTAPFIGMWLGMNVILFYKNRLQIRTTK